MTSSSPLAEIVSAGPVVKEAQGQVGGTLTQASQFKVLGKAVARCIHTTKFDHKVLNTRRSLCCPSFVGLGIECKSYLRLITSWLISPRFQPPSPPYVHDIIPEGMSPCTRVPLTCCVM